MSGVASQLPRERTRRINSGEAAARNYDLEWDGVRHDVDYALVNAPRCSGGRALGI